MSKEVLCDFRKFYVGQEVQCGNGRSKSLKISMWVKKLYEATEVLCGSGISMWIRRFYVAKGIL